MTLTGKSAAPGIAVGSIYIYNEKFIIPSETFIPPGQEQAHLDRYLSIKKQVLDELELIRLNMEKTDPDKALIFDAHKEIAEDIIINEEIPVKILKEYWSGDWAIYQVYETVISVLSKTADPMIAERAADFDDVRSRFLRLWYGQNHEGLGNIKEPVIIAARDLKPSDTACLNKEKTLAILTEVGGETCHTAIIAKSCGIPAVLGIGGLLNYVKKGQCAAVNAGEGIVVLDPEDDVVADYAEKSNALRKDREDAEIFQSREGRTSCGEKIDIGLNLSSVSEGNEELKAQAFTDFLGLFRTEFLFMDRNSLPSEEDQFVYYCKVLECFGNKPVILRVLDIGADKQIPYMNLKNEENPFLGIRGIRFCFNNINIFKTQLRAALRAAVYGNLWLMLPMISSIDEIRKAKEIISEVKNELKNDKLKFGDVKIGIMIEVPSIALIADLAAKEADFASIGSNDLCQYICAADRMNNAAESYYNKYHPAVFRLLKQVIISFNAACKPLSLCGELGNDPLAVPVLIGLGLRKLSMGAASVADVKRKIASITVEKAEHIADNVLEMETADEVKRYLSCN